MSHLQLTADFLTNPATKGALIAYYTGKIDGARLKVLLTVLSADLPDHEAFCSYLEPAINFTESASISSSGAMLYGIYDIDSESFAEDASFDAIWEATQAAYYEIISTVKNILK